MASNILSGGWSVQILNIPASIDFAQLAAILDLPKPRVRLPRAKNNETRHGWVNDFISEDEANKFASKWSGFSILGQPIKCLALSSSPRNDGATPDTNNTGRNSPKQPLGRSSEIGTSRQHGPRVNPMPRQTSTSGKFLYTNHHHSE